MDGIQGVESHNRSTCPSLRIPLDPGAMFLMWSRAFTWLPSMAEGSTI